MSGRLAFWSDSRRSQLSDLQPAARGGVGAAQQVSGRVVGLGLGRQGVTQARLAELLDVSPRVYNRWEKEAVAPRLDTVVRIAELLDVNLHEFVGRQEPQESRLRFHNPKLHQLYQEIDRLSDEDQQALVILLDSLIKRSQMGEV